MLHRRRLLQASAALAPASLALPVFASAAPTMPKDQAAAHALNRLGFGPRPGDLAAVAQDPRAWVEQQLRPQSLALPATLTAKLRESQLVDADPVAAMAGLISHIEQNQGAGNALPAANGMQPPAPPTPVARFVRGWQQPAVESRLFRALESPRQLEEVMVDFWFNHFNVFQGKNLMRVLVGHYEHHAIRPFALGRFRDLLGATAHHPAMLYYLDNWNSVATRAGAGRGLNENYARELMELHTLGADGGYTQQDVTELARMLTGWTIVSPRAGVPRNYSGPAPVVTAAPGRSDNMPGFLFHERVHDQGEKTWLGQRIAPAGQAEGEQALDLLARHPATARHIAFKLAQYFVSDQPEPALVQRLAAVFTATDGQITPVLRALFESEAFWSPKAVGAKFKTPYHYALSTLRAGGWKLDNGLALAANLAGQGMPLYGCATPDGYKNTEAAWLNPDGLTKRLNFATRVAAGRLGEEALAGIDSPGLLAQQLGPLATPATRSVAAQHAQEPAVALALVLAGPGMMRR